MIPRENDYILGVIALNKRDILKNSVSRPLVPIRPLVALKRGQHMYSRAVHTVQVPGLAASNILVELQRLILR